MVTLTATPAAHHEAHWQARLADLIEFHRRHGHANIPVESKENRSLGIWLKQQRRMCRKGLLSEHRRRQLDAIGVDWNPKQELEVQWDQHFSQLMDFHRVHGHVNVPVQYTHAPTLGPWLKKQRARHRQGLLTQERSARLESLGIVWNPKRAAQEARLAELAEFRSTHGHADIPTGWKPNTALSAWVKKQRSRARAGRLPMALRERMSALDVKWRAKLVNDDLWELHFAELVKFQVTYGHCGVPKGWPPSPSLTSWIKKQRYEARRGILNPERQARLEDLGLDWNPKEQQTVLWEQRCEELAQFRHQHGHSDVPVESKTHPTLGRWLKKQRSLRRRGRLDPARAARLESLDIDWNPKGDPEAQWIHQFAALAEWHRQHGNFRPRKSHQPSLWHWVRNQRELHLRGRLSPHRTAQLEVLGFPWEA